MRPDFYRRLQFFPDGNGNSIRKAADGDRIYSGNGKQENTFWPAGQCSKGVRTAE